MVWIIKVLRQNSRLHLYRESKIGICDHSTASAFRLNFFGLTYIIYCLKYQRSTISGYNDLGKRALGFVIIAHLLIQLESIEKNYFMKTEFTKYYHYRRSIGDRHAWWETHRRPTCLIGDLGMLHRRPIWYRHAWSETLACFIGNRHVPDLESLHYSNIHKWATIK